MDMNRSLLSDNLSLAINRIVSVFKQRKKLFERMIADRNLKSCEFSEVLKYQVNEEGFNRLDIIVRLLALENEMGLNTYGWKLYEKMQSKRNSEGDEQIRKRIERYKNLIYKRVDYEKIPIVLDCDFKLYDGSHRMALGIYNNASEIKYVIDHELGKTDTNYGIRWFITNDFSEDEVGIISERCKAVLEHYCVLC